MAQPPNFTISCTRNGNLMDVCSGQFSRSGSDSNIKWQLTTVGPMKGLNIESDVFSCEFSVAGKSWYRFKECKADGATSKNSSSEVGDTVSGSFSLVDTDIMSLGCPKTLCFCNADWVAKVFGPTMVRNGVLMTRASAVHGGGRVIHPKLPGVEFQEGTFEVIPLSGASHHSVAKWLANVIGMNVVITTEDIPLIDTFTVASGTSWIDAIKANFSIWSPDFRIEASLQEGGKPTLYILDVINSQGPSVSSPIRISGGVIDSIQHNKDSRGSDANFVDHVIVIGRVFPGTTFVEDPDFTPRKIPEISLSPNFERTFDMPVSEMLAYKKMGEYQGEFGVGDDKFTISQVQKAVCTYKYYRYYDQNGGGEQYLILEEIHDTIDKQGNVVSRIRTERKYGEGYKNIRTEETEYVRTNMPGSSSQQLKKMKIKHTFQNYVIKTLNQAMTNEFVEEVVLVDRLKKAGLMALDNPNPMLSTKRIDRTRTAVDKKPTTTQATIEMTTKFKRTFISRTSDSVLEKRDLDFDVLSAAARLNSQVIQNPKPQQATGKGETFRREYFNGPGVRVGNYLCYRKTITIKHDDICTDHIAEALAERAFYSRDTDVVSMSIKMDFPIPIGVLPVKVTVPSFDMDTNSGATEAPPNSDNEAMVPSSASTSNGGDFYVYQVDEKFSTSRDYRSPNRSFEQTLQVRSRL